MSDIRSLTRSEAEERGALVDVHRYDIAVDLTGLLEGEVWESESTVRFGCRTPGATTFVDCVGEVRRATLNGRDLELGQSEDRRIRLPDLQADNELVVAMAQPDTASSAGILRTVDPVDGLVYVWTSLECDEARRLWACFDQPDLKAPHRFTVTAPEAWTVTSNGAPESVVPAGVSAASGPARLWTFPDTPPLSTYVVVVNAGPFHEIRERRGGHDLGLYCRQSLRQFLERDADELFTLTEQGLSFFGERFGMPFPQERYDQVFVPNMGGAMENWGCVTWTDAVLWRSDPSHVQRETTANILLHEMAHMWFGDLVTMRWWDDLWLNEAFASWAATWGLASATRYTDAWAGFLATNKADAYRLDLSPASHPIRGDVPDVASAMANFDAITYSKGQSVLRQLVAYVGEESFVEGLRGYFARHAWGNTRLADLIDAVAEASGRDLSEWSRVWFDRAGTDLLRVVDGRLVAEAPDADGPRPHHLRLGLFADRGDHLERTGSVPVEVTGPDTGLPPLPDHDLVLPNDEDLTFAAVRTTPESFEILRHRAGRLPDPLARMQAAMMAWDMLVRGEIGAGPVQEMLLGILEAERTPGTVELLLQRARQAATDWSAEADLGPRLARLAEVAAALAQLPEHRTPALRALASAATSGEHLSLLAEAARDDRDLAWRLLARRAELGDTDEEAIARLLAEDPDPEAGIRALGVRACAPEPAGKEAAWTAIWTERRVPAGGPLAELAACLWRPGQRDLLAPYADRYLTEATAPISAGMLALGALVRTMFPYQADAAFADRAELAAAVDGVPSRVRSLLTVGVDTLRRMERSRRA